MDPKRVVDRECHTGEGPLWHPDDERVYWVDIPRGELFRYDPARDDHELCYETTVIGGFTIQEDGALLLFEDDGTIEAWDHGDVETVVEEIPAERGTQFNDVIADPIGGVFCGTMATEDHPGRLYRLGTDATLTELESGIVVPNGMGFTPDRRGFYFTDTVERTIYRYDYDGATGEIADREPFVEWDGDGFPDGMTVDADGYVWSAMWDGSQLVRFSPDGAPVDSVTFPARKVSSVTFGGPDYDVAYVTTALASTREEPGSREDEGDGAGALFEADLDADGVPEFRSRVDL